MLLFPKYRTTTLSPKNRRAMRSESSIFVCKSKSYVQNYADFGFQFERLLTGGQLDGRHDPNMVENLRLLKIGGRFTVLVAAEVDAMDAGESSLPGARGKKAFVEIKSGNPRYFGTKVTDALVGRIVEVLEPSCSRLDPEVR